MTHPTRLVQALEFVANMDSRSACNHSGGMNNSSTVRLQRNCTNCELRSLRMFCNLDARALEDFAALGVQSSVPRGFRLFQEDDPSGDVIVLCTGQVKLFCASREGKILILKIAMPGDVLGLGAVISGSKYGGNCRGDRTDGDQEYSSRGVSLLYP